MMASDDGYRYGCKGCCVYPHGRLSIVAAIVAVITFSLSSVAVNHCKFASAPVDDFLYRYGNFSSNYTGINIGIGLFTVEDPVLLVTEVSAVCTAYPSFMVSEMDTAFRAARAFGGLGHFCISIGTVMTLVMSCVSFKRIIVRITAIVFWFGSLLILLTMSFFATDLCSGSGACLFSSSAAVALVCSAFAAGAGAILFYTPEESMIEEMNTEGSTNEYQEATILPGRNKSRQRGGVTKTTTEYGMPDGEKKVATAIRNEDRSQSLDEITVPFPPHPEGSSSDNV